MRKKLFVLMALATLTFQSKAQLSDEEYAYVTMDLQGILNLTMTSDPTVNFEFKTIPEYQNGITKFNATKLDVDATVAWDLFAYASTNNWTQVDNYSTSGQAALPAEILEMQAIRPNASAAPANFNVMRSLKGLTNSGVAGGVPTAATQFLAGMMGTAAGQSYAPGAASSSPTTNQFRIHYRLKPSIPATFPNSTVALAAPGFAQSGYYYLEVVYSLIENL